jgi:hypothetical protein
VINDKTQAGSLGKLGHKTRVDAGICLGVYFAVKENDNPTAGMLWR